MLEYQKRQSQTRQTSGPQALHTQSQSRTFDATTPNNHWQALQTLALRLNWACAAPQLGANQRP